MPTKRTVVRMLFGGGWVSDVGPSINLGASQSGDLTFPYLTTAQNIFYEPDGAPHKIPGTSKVNATVLESGANIMGLFDFWRNSAGTITQKRIVHVSTKIKAETSYGTFADIQTGMTDNAVPCYTLFQNNLIMSNDAGDAPQTYNGTTCTALGGTPPAFQFSTNHRQRVWASGVTAAPDTLYYSSLNNAAQWNGAGTSGTLTVGSGDGDQITGLVSVGADLYVFKGPYYGSIWKILGSSSTGADAFSISPMPVVKGIGAVWHSSIFKFRNDVGFMWSDGSIYSLATASNYGAYGEGALSRPIRAYIRANVNLQTLATVSVAVNEERSFALICVPVASASFPNQILMMDYSRDNVWWAEWPALNGACVARTVANDQRGLNVLCLGGADGFVRITDEDPSIDGTTAYTGKAVTPFTNFGSALLTKTISNASVTCVPKGNYNLTFGYRRDKQPQKTETLAQGNTNTAWPFVDVFAEAEGEFKNIQFEVSQAGLNQDMEVHAITASIEIGGEETAQLPTSGA